MTRQAIVLTLLVTLGNLPATAAAARAPGAPREDAAPTPCTSLKSANPLLSDSIGLVYEDASVREIAEGAVERWASCAGYRTDFPAFLVGHAGTQTVRVAYVQASSRQPYCATFNGRTIVLYAYALDRKSRPRSCGSAADLLAHELGHVLGLRDAPDNPFCIGHTMSHIDPSWRVRREPRPDECRAVAAKWLTTREADAELALAVASPDDGAA